MRREPLLAALLCVVGACLVLVSAGRTWVTVQLVSTPLLPPQALAVVGSDLAAGLSALGLAGLAGVLALAASHGRGRVVVGLVLGAVGLGVLAVVARLVVDGLTDAALATRFVRDYGSEPASTAVSAWPWICVLGGLLLVLAGLVVAVRGRRWAALGRRYEAPAATATAATPATAAQAVEPTAPPEVAGPVAERGLWEALDRGEDPTGPAPADPADTTAEGRG